MERERSNVANGASQEYLLQLWRAQLNAPNVGVLDDFFEAGGSSMQLIEMLMTVTDEYGKEIDYNEFLKEPCIRKLGELLES